MTDDERIEEFKKLAMELYSEGYNCGFSDQDEGCTEYAIAMNKIANGTKHHEDLIE